MLTGGATLSRCAPVPFSFVVLCMLGRVWIQEPFQTSSSSNATAAYQYRCSVFESAIAVSGLVPVENQSFV